MQLKAIVDLGLLSHTELVFGFVPEPWLLQDERPWICAFALSCSRFCTPRAHSQCIILWIPVSLSLGPHIIFIEVDIYHCLRIPLLGDFIIVDGL